MSYSLKNLALKWFHSDIKDLTEREYRVLERMVERRRISRNVNSVFQDGTTRGQRLADSVAKFGGSWSFIIMFLVILIAWIGINAALVWSGKFALDPYPFIFLNLILSMLAAIQAPIIMMSQNRQSEKDRLSAGYDYEVNLKAELEIMQLHEKIDELRQSQLSGLMELQIQQVAMLESLIEKQLKQP